MQLIRNLLENPSLVIAQRFLGKAIFAWRAVHLGRLHLRPFQMSVISALRSGQLLMDRDAESAVRWWTQPPTEGLSLKAHSADLSMTTDASTVGWGATLDHRSASDLWSRKEMDLHINHLELLAVLRAVQGFILTLRSRAMTVHLDNVTAAAYLMKVFRRLDEPEVDLFASNRSAQVERYFTLDRRDKKAAGINALEKEWDFELMYAFPPPQLISRILDRMNEHRETLILIIPFWTRAAWLPELIQMSMKQPLRLPLQQSTVSDLSTGRDLPSLSKLRLTVWTICGKPSRSREQIRLWRSSSADHGGDPRSLSMRAHGEHGRSGVADTLYLGLSQL